MDWGEYLRALFTGAAPIEVLAIGAGAGFAVGMAIMRYLNPAVKELKAQVKERDKELSAKKDELSNLRQERGDCYAKLSASETRLREHQEVRTALLSTESEIWSMHPAERPENYAQLPAATAKTLVIANLKGGVGKTTLAANLAAYFCEKRSKRVLLIDLDYQGSLSIMCLRAADLSIPTEATAKGAMLTPMSPANVLQASSDLNRILANCRLLTASYDLTAFENRLMLQWLFREGDGDVRYRLAAFLLSPEVQRRFDLVIIDTPPRATTTMVNALCAGHFLLVPTVLDRLSAETVANFMKQAKRLCREQGLNPTLEVLGAVPTLVAGINAESDAMPAVRDGLKLWGPNTHIFTAMRRNAEFSNYAGTDIAYLKSKAVRDDLIGPLGDEVAMRIGL